MNIAYAGAHNDAKKLRDAKTEASFAGSAEKEEEADGRYRGTVRA